MQVNALKGVTGLIEGDIKPFPHPPPNEEEGNKKRNEEGNNMKRNAIRNAGRLWFTRNIPYTYGSDSK